jgi:hypothetical protein
VTGCAALLTECRGGDQTENSEMGRACSSMADRGDSYMVLVTRPEGKNRLEDLVVNGWLMLIWVFKK